MILGESDSKRTELLSKGKFKRGWNKPTVVLLTLTYPPSITSEPADETLTCKTGWGTAMFMVRTACWAAKIDWLTYSVPILAHTD